MKVVTEDIRRTPELQVYQDGVEIEGTTGVMGEYASPQTHAMSGLRAHDGRQARRLEVVYLLEAEASG